VDVQPFKGDAHGDLGGTRRSPVESCRYFTFASFSVIFCGFDERHFGDTLFFKRFIWHLAEISASPLGYVAYNGKYYFRRPVSLRKTGSLRSLFCVLCILSAQLDI
jgi:hypothetical protein